MELAKNVNIKWLDVKKFKTVTVNFDFYLPFKKEYHTAYYLLCDLIGEYSKKYPSKQTMTKTKDLLYGLSVESMTGVLKNVSHFVLSYSFLDPRFVDDVDYEDYLTFIKDTLFDLYVDDNLFAEVRSNFEDRIRRQLDKPNVYLHETMLETLAFDDKLFGYKKIDKRQELKELTLETLQNAYRSLLEEAVINIFVLGANEDFVKSFKTLPFKDRSKTIIDYTPVSLKEHGLITIDKDISQTYLEIMYENGCCSDLNVYVKALVATVMLGMGPTSLLFTRVREESSLCYNIYASIYQNEGLCSITSAISKKNLNKTLMLIDEIIDDLKKGNFSEELLSTSKEYLINNLLSGSDTARNIIDFEVGNVLHDRDISLKDYLALISKVTFADVKEVFNRFVKKATVVLEGNYDE